MVLLVRTVAFLLGLVSVAGPVIVALVVASVEPSQPVQWSWITPFILGGLAAALGYIGVVFAPNRIAHSALRWRMLMAVLMLLPSAVAMDLLIATGSSVVAAVCLSLVVATVWLCSACVWPAWLARAESSV